MKSIQHFANRAFLYFAIGLIGLAVVSLVNYGLFIYEKNRNLLEQTGYEIQLQTTAALRATSNNILIAQAVMLDRVKHRAIDKDFTGKVLASTINYNPSQYNIWFTLNKKFAETLPGKPKGLMFLVLRNKEKYLTKDKRYLGSSLQSPFLYENYATELYYHDTYYTDPSLPWYQKPLQNKDEIVYINAYYDKIYTNQWLFTYAKSVYNSKNEFVGVAGIDFALDVVRAILKKYSGDLGLMVFQATDGKLIFDLPHKTQKNFKDESITANAADFFGNLSQLEELQKNETIEYRKIKNRLSVMKVYKTLNGSWYFVVHQDIWSFYGSILPFLLGISFVIIVTLGGLLYYLKRNKRKVLEPIEELLRWLKRDIPIIGSDKQFSGHYAESEILEINELISCINTLFEVVNENFQNYRIELEKNIKTKEELEQLVQIRSEQLIEREKMAALGFMSAGLAHEIKNPLNLICNAAEIISLQLHKLDKANVELEEWAKRALSRILESNQIVLNNGQRVDNIIKTLLLQVRNTKEGQEHLVEMKELIKTNLDFVLANYRPKLNNRMHVEVVQPDNRVVLRGNPVDLGRAFINILDNSCYAMIKKINHDPQFNADLKITLIPKEQTVEIKIRDNGTGISKNDLSQIFTPFFTTKPPGEGTGLGLNFVYEIIKQHGGRLEIQSKEGEYTEISMNIPYKGRP